MLPEMGIIFISTFEKSCCCAAAGTARASPAASVRAAALVMGSLLKVQGIRNCARHSNTPALPATPDAQDLVGDAADELPHLRKLGRHETDQRNADIGEQLGEEGAIERHLPRLGAPDAAQRGIAVHLQEDPD